jgi:hypothetical protein
MYYGCKKCEAFAHSNPSQFFENEGRCPDCYDDHESMINHIEWQKATMDFVSYERGNKRGFAIVKGNNHCFINSISGEINS